MKFEDLFSPSEKGELLALEQRILKKEHDVLQAQTELTGRFLITRSVRAAHLVLNPTAFNAAIEFEDGSILILEALPETEWVEIVRCALNVSNKSRVVLKCLYTNTTDCYVQLDRDGILIAFHPTFAYFEYSE